MKLAIVTILIAAWFGPPALSAQQTTSPPKSQGPYTEHQRGLYASVGKILVASAQAMPDDRLSYRPADGIRSFAEILAHAAASQYYFCSAVRGEKRPPSTLDPANASKTDLIAALETAFAYCDETYAALTDATGAVPMTFMNSETPRLAVLGINNLHLIEHYGNLVTYMRMNGVVPPTSDPEFMKTLH